MDMYIAAIKRQLVRSLRHRLGLTQEQLGQAIGKEQPYVSDLERGVRRVVAVQTLERLSQALGVTMEALLTAQERRRWARQHPGKACPGPRSRGEPGVPEARTQEV